MTDLDPNALSRLAPEDREALAALGRGSEWLRALSCTLARRGKAYRLASPDRATAVIEALERSPVFKGGQFFFDLLEWEDFMLDGPPPPTIPMALAGPALRRLARWLESVRAHLDGAQAPAAPGTPMLEPVPESDAKPEDGDLPALEAADYLFHDVVLGIVRSTGPWIAAAARR